VQLSANAGSLITSKYDEYFKDSAIFLPVGTDWRLLKAQCFQESSLNPLAQSPVGAMGLCQFMPLTAKDMKARHPGLNNFWLPETSIRASALYMNQMNKFWSSPRSDTDRYMLALASYNAGAGHLVKAQKLCGMGVKYSEIINCLPSVTGRHSEETIGYVKNIIGKWYVYLLFN
jgi:membrane-bound lytic murein transglycosylase MltF